MVQQPYFDSIQDAGLMELYGPLIVVVMEMLIVILLSRCYVNYFVSWFWQKQPLCVAKCSEDLSVFTVNINKTVINARDGKGSYAKGE